MQDLVSRRDDSHAVRGAKTRARLNAELARSLAPATAPAPAPIQPDDELLMRVKDMAGKWTDVKTVTGTQMDDLVSTLTKCGGKLEVDNIATRVRFQSGTIYEFVKESK